LDDGHSPPKVTEVEPTVTSQDGINLIKSFEGLRLTSYYCASNVLTIGYGSTGPHVTEGMTITEAEAEALLRQDLKRFEKAVVSAIIPKLTQHEFDAIVSFTFNCGIGALNDSTFCYRINNGEDKATCFEQEFPKWVRGANGKPLPGLVRRREAEVYLATS
jgi:lysozyme